MDFDDYRKRYGELTDADHKAAYQGWHLQYPEQRHCTLTTLARFFREHPFAFVIEMGGWDGYAAGMMLAQFPALERWLNVEICAGAANRGVEAVTDPRFFAYIPEQFKWWRGEIRPTPDTALVASHVIEHLNDADAEELIRTVRPGAWYIEAPLTEGGQTWEGYGGSHVLTAGWDRVTAWLEHAGYKLAWAVGDSRSYVRA